MKDNKDKKMKKVLLGLGLAAVLGASVANARGIDLFVSDIEYYWNVKSKDCTKSDFGTKKLIMKYFQDGLLIINKQYKNDAGVWTWLEGEDKDGSYSIYIFNTYGECKAYEKAIVQNQEITDWAYFANLKDPAVKK